MMVDGSSARKLEQDTSVDTGLENSNDNVIHYDFVNKKRIEPDENTGIESNQMTPEERNQKNNEELAIKAGTTAADIYTGGAYSKSKNVAKKVGLGGAFDKAEAKVGKYGGQAINQVTKKSPMGNQLQEGLNQANESGLADVAAGAAGAAAGGGDPNTVNPEGTPSSSPTPAQPSEKPESGQANKGAQKSMGKSPFSFSNLPLKIRIYIIASLAGTFLFIIIIVYIAQLVGIWELTTAGGGSSTTNNQSSPGAVPTDLVELAIESSWPLGHQPRNHAGCDANPGCGMAESTEAYRQARIIAEERTYQDHLRNLFSSCDRFVATMLRATGVDESFPWGATTQQWNHLSNSPNWRRVSCQDRQPGDVVITQGNGHVAIFVGDIDGQMILASASIGTRTGTLTSGSYCNGEYFVMYGSSRFRTSVVFRNTGIN